MPLYFLLFLHLLLVEHTLAFFFIRPFVKPHIPIHTPTHNFWPFVPINTPTTHTPVIPTHNFWPFVPINTPPTHTSAPPPTASTDRPFFQLPTHNFWPWIPIKSPITDGGKNQTKKTYFQVPTHNFWPFIPISKPGGDRKPSPTLPPPTKLPIPTSSNRYNYGEVIHKSILFYEVQRSGRLPSNRNIKWRGHSAVGDRGHRGEDLTGGWYDAGDYVKFGVPMATATSMLLWGLVEHPDAYKASGLYDDMLASIKWPLDYFLKAHCAKYELYGQVGDPYIDHTYWGRPEDMSMERPAYKLTPNRPGSDLVADTSSALTLGYLAFKNVEPRYAKKLLEHAKELFEFADFYRGAYTESIDNAWEFYKSFTDEDELAWAAIWLYRATLSSHYLNKARKYTDKMDGCWAQSWADKSCSVPVLMYQMTKERQYRSMVESNMAEWLPGGDIDYTPKGLAFRGPWGTLRYTANMAFIALRAADVNIRPSTYRKWARGQIHYMLGDGGRSYVVGYGHKPPTRPHHASSSCPPPPAPCTWDDYIKPEPNAHVLFGALVGGPDMNDNFVDSRSDFIHNEVGCEYNAGFQSALAALKSLELKMPP